MTPPEVLLWMRLRGRGPGRPVFRRQHPFGPYILDFYCAQARLVIEVDGQGHGMGDRPEHDARRDAFLAQEGLRVIRYLASEVMADPNGIAQSIFEAACWKPGR
jgi:very-short-patch-repair endonuclease